MLQTPAEANSVTCADNMNRLRPLFLSDTFTGGLVTEESVVLSPDFAMKLLAQHSFPKSSLNWIGGSLFASVKVTYQYSRKLEDIYVMSACLVAYSATTNVSSVLLFFLLMCA